MTPLQLMLTTTKENSQQASARQNSERTTPPKFFNPFSQLYITPPPRAKLKNHQNIKKFSQINQQIL